MSRILLSMLACAIALAGATLAPYFYTFHGKLSDSSQDWSNFGGYVGGSLGPIYALLAFAAGVQTLIDNRRQAKLQSLLTAIQRCEDDFDKCCSRTVTCDRPWVWANLPNETFDVTRVSLRSLLFSDSVNWEDHLWPLITGHGFQVLPGGEISQDREVVLQAILALNGIYRYLSLYEQAGGEQQLAEFLRRKYKIAQARLESASKDASEGLARDA